MAKDILIIPGSGSIDFSGSAYYTQMAVSDSGSISITRTDSGSDSSILAVDGVNGRLFEVSDDLSDSLFSVNTVAGLPVIEAFADNRVILGTFSSPGLTVSGSSVKATGSFTGSFTGDGTGLTGLFSMTGTTSDGILTYNSANNATVESDLTFSSGYLCNNNTNGVIQSSCIAAVGAIPALYTQKNSSGCIYLYSDEYCTCLNYHRTGHGFVINKASSGLAFYVDPSSSPTVTINATSPQSQTLYVGGTLKATGNVTFDSNLTVDTNTLYVDSSLNRVGIGTTTPAVLLDVRGSARFNACAGNHDFSIGTDACTYTFFVDGGTDKIGIGGNNPAWKLDIGAGNISNDNTIGICPGNGGTAIRVAGVNNDVTLLRVANVITSDAGNYGFSLRYNGSGTGNNNSLSIFSDNCIAGSQTEAVTILQDGNVGIGASSPSYKLEVVGTVSGSFIGDGSGLTGIAGGGGGSSIFAATGSVYSTTNDLEVTGSFGVSGSLEVVGTVSGSFIGDGSGLTGIAGGGGGSIFAATGSVYATTNDLEVSGSFKVSGSDATIHGLTVGRGSGDIISNTAVGCSALEDNTTGISNSAFGDCALASVTTGISNVGIGRYAGRYITTGISNVIIGAFTNDGGNTSCVIAIGGAALSSNSSSNLVAVGTRALYSNSTGCYNTAVGHETLCLNSSGQRNTAVGYQAIQCNYTGNYNTAVGYFALRNATFGNCNSAFGHNVLANVFNGCNNVGVGYNAGCAITSGDFNVIIGHSANDAANTDSVVAIGYQALTSNSGDNLVAVGTQALCSNTTGNCNTAVGDSAGSTVTTGTNLTLLGYDAEPSSATATNEITLGDSNVTKLRIPGIGAEFTATNSIITGSLELTNILTLTPTDTTPVGAPTGSIIVSGSATGVKPYFWNGSTWTAMI